MSDTRMQDRWSEAELDRALMHTLLHSPVRVGGFDRVRAAVQQTSGVDLVQREERPPTASQPDARRDAATNLTRHPAFPRFGNTTISEPRRRRAGVVIAATVAAVGLVVGVPWLVLQDGGQGTSAVTVSSAPMTVADCAQHNESTGGDPVGPGQPGGTTQSPQDGWYTTGKDAELTSALRAALPAGTCVFKGSDWGSLTFGPSLNSGGADGRAAVGTSDTQAAGRLVTDRGDGTLSASIFRSAGSDNCLAGSYDNKMTAADGSVTWALTSSATSADTSWVVLVVTTYRTDGTCSVLRVSDEVLGSDATPPRSGMTASGRPPLTIDDLTQIAQTPKLDIGP